MSYADLYRSRVGWKEGVWPVLTVVTPTLELGEARTTVRYEERPCRCGSTPFLYSGEHTRAGIRVFLRCRNWTAETAAQHSPAIVRYLPYPPLPPGAQMEWEEGAPEA